MAIKKYAVNPEDDLGFGTQAVRQRIINRDGSINVKRLGIPFFSTTNTYHRLITMKWSSFWVTVITAYIIVNVFFALLYLFIGIQNLHGTGDNNVSNHFLNAFFFSAQTLSTVGYGHISPAGNVANWVAAFESMIGLLAFALATGLLYGRFSRPSAKFVFSENLLIAPYAATGGRGLMFRLANMRLNILLDVAIEVTFSFNEIVDGKTVRRFYTLPLERTRVSILTLSWTVVHPLTEDSPLYSITAEDMKSSNATFNILIQAFDDTFSQTVHSRTSYQHDEIIWGAKFVPAFSHDQDGQVQLHLGKISDYTDVELPIIG
ncbi:ion channel [Mucilaginibacter polytrichastri]|uniref:Uncharacterized protein n=1 Tax=Mucilaginibacter polytrichastri TaxID=1302689 RepID=A0A1Q5ZX59_9SPHI|nr:ion channel [Mucilaginibacter polytrichastri]OKS86356.1 hypothetical protein RG47T_1810 [Mucilaginibacter polytrichastri]SFT20962.1 inward rectifier potassium channel [Mucilaginibacter polytrichastri]